MQETSESGDVDPENGRDFLVETYLQKPWSVQYSFDTETKQYEIWVPELDIGTCAPTRLEAGWALEDALAAYFDGCIDTNTLDQIPEPKVGGRPTDE